MLLRWCPGSTTSGRRFSKQTRQADQRPHCSNRTDSSYLQVGGCVAVKLVAREVFCACVRLVCQQLCMGCVNGHEHHAYSKIERLPWLTTIPGKSLHVHPAEGPPR